MDQKVEQESTATPSASEPVSGAGIDVLTSENSTKIEPSSSVPDHPDPDITPEKSKDGGDKEILIQVDAVDSNASLKAAETKKEGDGNEGSG